MNIASKGLSALGKLFALVVIASAFLFGMASVVYMSLQGEEVRVPDLVGKDLVASKNELAEMGLKVHQKANRFSNEPPNTILEQLPKPGETVKTGQLILVVVSKASGEADEVPATLKKTTEEDDTEKIEEMISEKPKKVKANTNSSKKKADKTRDVIGNASDSNSGGAATENKKETSPEKQATEKENKLTIPGSGDKPAEKSATPKPAGGENRPRATVKP